ncbi:MAG: hypothetical protein HC942_06980, partial [Microcoleus sp. SU_5_6]|nr:hypothetical protein [Microcoleus sp. SU_5_6]
SSYRKHQRRKNIPAAAGGVKGQKPKLQAIAEPPEPEYQQLEIFQPAPFYGVSHQTTQRAAESPQKWGENDDREDRD